MAAEIASTQTELAAAVGRSKGWMSRLVRKPWFPARGPDGWDVAEVQRAIRRHVATRPAKSATSSASSPSSPASARPSSARSTPRRSPTPPADDAPTPPLEPSALSLALRDEEAPIAVLRIAMRAAAGALAQAMDRGDVNVRDIDAVKKSVEELRKAEAGYLALAERRRELIERVTALQVAGAIAQRLVEILANVEALLAAQVEVWVDDEAFRARGTEERGREVRAWFDGQARALRSSCADDLERMVEEAEAA